MKPLTITQLKQLSALHERVFDLWEKIPCNPFNSQQDNKDMQESLQDISNILEPYREKIKPTWEAKDFTEAFDIITDDYKHKHLKNGI